MIEISGSVGAVDIDPVFLPGSRQSSSPVVQSPVPLKGAGEAPVVHLATMLVEFRPLVGAQRFPEIHLIWSGILKCLVDPAAIVQLPHVKPTLPSRAPSSIGGTHGAVALWSSVRVKVVAACVMRPRSIFSPSALQ
jgi:hypothetical protein